MAIFTSDPTIYLHRLRSFDETQDWTYRISVYFSGQEAGDRSLLLLDDTANYATPWSAIGMNGGAHDISFASDPGTGEVDSANVSIDLDTWHDLYLLYDSTAHTLQLLVDETVIDTISITYSSNFLDELLGTNGLNAANIGLTYVRVWQAILTADERALENRSTQAVRTADLVADTPLTSPADLTDISGNHNDWTATGVFTAFTGPYLPIFTDQFIMSQLQNIVIEPPDGGQTWPSGLWSMDEVVSYLNQRQNRFLKDTHFQFGIADIAVTSGTGIYDLPDDWINTIRVLWINTDGVVKELPRSDTWEADNGIPTWSYVNSTPLIFYDGGKPITILLMPTPDANGTLQVHYVPYSALLDGTGELMTLPDEFVPVVKYGALADMLSKVARSQDTRAQYCEQRYNLGVEIARLLVGGFK